MVDLTSISISEVWFHDVSSLEVIQSLRLYVYVDKTWMHNVWDNSNVESLGESLQLWYFFAFKIAQDCMKNPFLFSDAWGIKVFKCLSWVSLWACVDCCCIRAFGHIFFLPFIRRLFKFFVRIWSCHNMIFLISNLVFIWQNTI